MLSTITTRGRAGYRTRFPGPGVPSVAGPIVVLSFALPLAGQVPHVLQITPPQQCQNSVPNVALQVAVLDQNGNAVDISAANALQFWFLAPDNTARPVPAAFVSNGLDGLLQHITSAQDLNEAGLWRIQAQITFGTQTLLTSWGCFWAGNNVVDIAS